MADWPELTEGQAEEIFVQLTVKAVGEETIEEFLDALLQRLLIVHAIDWEGIVASETEISRWLSMERQVYDRLNETRDCLLKMEQHATESVKNTAYRSRFPFPMIPAFLSQSA